MLTGLPSSHTNNLSSVMWRTTKRCAACNDNGAPMSSAWATAQRASMAVSSGVAARRWPLAGSSGSSCSHRWICCRVLTVQRPAAQIRAKVAAVRAGPVTPGSPQPPSCRAVASTCSTGSSARVRIRSCGGVRSAASRMVPSCSTVASNGAADRVSVPARKLEARPNRMLFSASCCSRKASA